MQLKFVFIATGINEDDHSPIHMEFISTTDAIIEAEGDLWEGAYETDVLYRPGVNVDGGEGGDDLDGRPGFDELRPGQSIPLTKKRYPQPKRKRDDSDQDEPGPSGINQNNAPKVNVYY